MVRVEVGPLRLPQVAKADCGRIDLEDSDAETCEWNWSMGN